MTESYQLLIIFGSITTILVCWSIFLFVKSKKLFNVTEKTDIKLINELEKHEETAKALKDAHQQLSSTTGYLNGIIQESTDLITAIDLDYRYISFNNSFRESMKEYFCVDIEVGMKLDDALVDFPKKLQDAKQLWNRSLKGEQFSAEQCFTRLINGTNIYELNYSPIKNKAGEIIGASQIARNVTEQKNLETKIRRERDFAAAIFDANKSLILVLDRDGRIIQFNKACEELTGYKADEVIGRIIWNVLIPSEDVARVKNKNRNFDKDENRVDFVNKWITKDERIKFISWQISTIDEENNTNSYIISTGIDITEKRESEIAEKRMLEILENSTDFISISDLHGKLSYMNSAGRAMIGLTCDEHLSTLRSNSFYPKWVQEKLKNEALPIANKNGTWLGKSAIMSGNGEEIPISQLIMAHRNENNVVEYFSTVIRDISYDQKITEDLAKAKESHQKTSEQASEFLANMSHEIRTPMNGVVGLAELLLNTDLTFEQRDYIESIQKSGDSLINIINDILDFSKLEAGKLEFEKAEFDLHNTIESTLELFKKPIHQKNLELCLNIHKNVPSALIGDPGRLGQVLINFIGNAVKFTDNGEILIDVSVEEQSNNPTLNFSIKDTGIGIKAKALQSLFTPFMQADSSITKRFGGSGLGLAISKQLITKMNGDLGASSKEGEGSTFWFTAKFEAQAIEKQRVFQDNNLKNVRILIVDDNKSSRNNLMSLTKSWGMLADETENGQDALRLLLAAAENGENFEVVIIDKKMPKMDGFVLSEKIIQQPQLRDTKILLMLSQIDRGEIQNSKDSGARNLIPKPVLQTKLFNLLVNLFTENNDNKINKIDTTLINPPIFSDILMNENGASTMNYELNTNKRILIAEDNLVNQKVILNQVSRLGYEVDLAENGKAAIDALQLKDYSLILMDCQMPIMDGYTATQKIRQAEKNSKNHIPIIAVTAHAIEGDREKCLAVGMDDYISKPTKQDVLAKTINFWLHKTTREIITKSPTTEPVKTQKPFKHQSETENIKARLIELEETCGRETVFECINLFLEDSGKLLESLKISVGNYDFLTIASEAHKLKGSSANMGAVRLPKFSQKLIMLARAEQRSTTTLIFKQILDEYELIKSFYLKTLKSFDNSVEKSNTSA